MERLAITKVQAGGEYKKHISFEELDRYIGKPLYNNEQKKWKIIKGYARVDDTLQVMYTECDWMRSQSNFELFTDTLLSDHEPFE